jgi:hypothetical protein
MTENQHPGINMHKLPVGGGFVGLVFAAGSALIFLLGLPALWYFVVFSAALGLGVALLLRFVNARRADAAKPLSIVSAMEKAPRQATSEDRGRVPLRSIPALDPA